MLLSRKAGVNSVLHHGILPLLSTLVKEKPRSEYLKFLITNDFWFSPAAEAERAKSG
jgi:hypothetical protein